MFFQLEAKLKGDLPVNYQNECAEIAFENLHIKVSLNYKYFEIKCLTCSHESLSFSSRSKLVFVFSFQFIHNRTIVTIHLVCDSFGNDRV